MSIKINTKNYKLGFLGLGGNKSEIPTELTPEQITEIDKSLAEDKKLITGEVSPEVSTVTQSKILSAREKRKVNPTLEQSYVSKYFGTKAELLSILAAGKNK